MPVVEAPCEAEAQCAVLARADKVYAAASEDMDTLTFGTPRLVRRMWASDAKVPLMEISLSRVLEGLKMDHSQFIDLCILCGCDYADTIRGIGPKSAVKLISQFGSLQSVLSNIDKEDYPVPEGVDWDEVRRLFVAPEVQDPAAVELSWTDPDEAGLMQFLVAEKGFNPARVETGIAKLRKARNSGSQMRMDSFFKAAAPQTGFINPKKVAAEKAAAAAAAVSGKGAKAAKAGLSGKKPVTRATKATPKAPKEPKAPKAAAKGKAASKKVESTDDAVAVEESPKRDPATMSEREKALARINGELPGGDDDEDEGPRISMRDEDEDDADYEADGKAPSPALGKRKREEEAAAAEEEKATKAPASVASTPSKRPRSKAASPAPAAAAAPVWGGNTSSRGKLVVAEDE
jgi:flap endonuclease-1